MTGLEPQSQVTRARSGTLVQMPYAVSTPVFEGPFDLLLHLILQQEVDIRKFQIREL